MMLQVEYARAPRLVTGRLLLGLALGAVVLAAGVSAVTRAHAQRAQREAICAAELRGVERRNPYIERFVRPVDPCLAVEIVRAGK